MFTAKTVCVCVFVCVRAHMHTCMLTQPYVILSVFICTCVYVCMSMCAHEFWRKRAIYNPALRVPLSQPIQHYIAKWCYSNLPWPISLYTGIYTNSWVIAVFPDLIVYTVQIQFHKNYLNIDKHKSYINKKKNLTHSR